MKFAKPLFKSVLAAFLAAVVSGAPAFASEHESAATEQAKYVRLHDAAVAFADSIGKISSRYGMLQKVDVAKAREMIRESEVDARSNEYAQANAHATDAYNLLRDGIREAVASGQLSAAAK